MSFLKRMMAKPPVKYGVLAACTGLWVLGLVEQLSTADAAARYLLVSLLMAAVAML